MTPHCLCHLAEAFIPASASVSQVVLVYVSAGKKWSRLPQALASWKKHVEQTRVRLCGVRTGVYF